MKRVYPSMMLLLLSILYCDGTARIQFREVSHDFGVLPQMTYAKHVFEFSNSGSGTLHIGDIKAG
ncbi:MAG: DUF1573 domain-containing protein [Spirochaetes bacterium]|nr:DUF1573 domain-containing protein [Spirochaetota bacterium]